MIVRASVTILLACLWACSERAKVSGRSAPLPSEPSGTSALVPSFSPRRSQVPSVVSVIDLAARPAEYEGRKVIVAGVLGADAAGLFVSHEHALSLLTEYGIALSQRTCSGGEPAGPERFSDLASYEGKYVRVEATFSTTVKGHLGEFRGGLCDLESVRDAEIAPAPSVLVRPARKAHP